MRLSIAKQNLHSNTALMVAPPNTGAWAMVASSQTNSTHQRPRAILVYPGWSRQPLPGGTAFSFGTNPNIRVVRKTAQFIQTRVHSVHDLEIIGHRIAFNNFLGKCSNKADEINWIHKNYFVGQKVRVYYNPNNPSDSTLLVGVIHGHIGAAFGLFFICLNALFFDSFSCGDGSQIKLIKKI